MFHRPDRTPKPSHNFPGLESGRPIVYGSDMPPAILAPLISLEVVENGWMMKCPPSS